MKTIYLDYNATTPLDPQVISEMRPFMEDSFGNPSSMHDFGIKARQGVELARRRIAKLLNCFPDEIIFTSGGTESNNMAVKGAALFNADKGNHIITSAIEHPAIFEVCRYLEGKGFRVTYLEVDRFGRVDPGDVRNSITPQTTLITIMHANNEVGTIQPLAEIGRIARERSVLFHTDAAQSIGKIRVDTAELGVDLLSIAGHKFYAPKGVGALFIRRGVQLEKMIHGANHERNLRAGTENVIEIAGLGKAAEIADTDHDGNHEKMKALRDHLFNLLRERIPGLILNGHPDLRLPNTLNVSFPGVDATTLLDRMKGIAASAGAACHSDLVILSPVLSAMKADPVLAMGTIRFSVGRMTEMREIDEAAGIIISKYEELVSSQGGEAGALKSNPDGVRLTGFTHSLGCACKIPPGLLSQVLGTLPRITDENVLVGPETSDDATVFRLDRDHAIVQTVDFIPPIVDDPYSYGAIAAANAISDVYAMGGTPLFALGIVAFPIRVLPLEVLNTILRGASDKLKEAGIFLAGGHSIEDNEPKFGLVVTGRISQGRILRNRGANPGDAIVLTKPVGTGILTTAMKRGLANEAASRSAITVMSQLNRLAGELMAVHPVSSCTDVTGFGLLGHLKEMISGTGTDAVIHSADVPLIENVMEYAAAGMVPGGTKNNFDFVADVVTWDENISGDMKLILCDAQTSGGLLLTLPMANAKQYVQEFPDRPGNTASIIGWITEGEGRIRVKG
jgi:cysteine desulfurase